MSDLTALAPAPTKPLYRRSETDRMAYAAVRRDQHVRVIEHPGRHRALERVHLGALVSVAWGPGSGASAIIVVRTVDSPHVDTSLSLATVASIEVVTDAG